MGLDMETIRELIYIVPSALIAITFHEFAHGYVSYLQGDITPYLEGRLSLNPFRHLDLIGTLCLILFKFGWARPVQVDASQYRHKKLGMALVALAGPLMNFIVTFVGLLASGIILRLFGDFLEGGPLFFYQLFYYIAIINAGLGVFNLIPIPPLDGSKVVGALLPERVYFGYMKYERYGAILLIVLLVFDVLVEPMTMVSSGLINGIWDFVTNLLGLYYY